MTQEDKDLLLKDLCARIPYGVKCAYFNTKDEIKVGELLTVWCKEKRVFIDKLSIDYDGGDHIGVIPCLFPLSSMTEEQKEELFNLCEFCIQEDWEGKKSEVYAIKIASRLDPAYCYDHTFNMWSIDMRAINYLLKNHFDINGLIPKGLAQDATNLNIY